MPQFIQALLGIAMSISTSFTHGGKPATLPVVNQQDATIHGSAVSTAATNLDLQNQNDQDTNNNTQNQTGNQTNNQVGNGQNPDTTRVSAENVRAGIQMPTFIPQVAIDHSGALDVSTGNLTAPGNNAGANIQGSTNANSNASFGQGISNSQPDSARTDGQTFGQSTAASARSNSKRP